MQTGSNIFAGTLATGVAVIAIIVGLAFGFGVDLTQAIMQSLPITVVAMLLAAGLLLVARFETAG